MNEKRKANSENADNAYELTREFNAPRELVFKAWTDKEALANWWGPKGFTMCNSKLELHPGGVFHYSIKSPDGHEMWGKFVFREVRPPEKLVFVNSMSDENGSITRHPMAPTWPAEIENTITFTESNGKTIMKIQWNPINPSDEELKTFKSGLKTLQGGFKGTLDKLEEYLVKA